MAGKNESPMILGNEVEINHEVEEERSCRVCGCTDLDCRSCIEATGEPCYWIEWDLCSRCRISG